MNSAHHKLFLAALFAITFVACDQSGTSPAAVVPVEIDSGTYCVLDGMILADYPGPKAQIHYAGQTMPDFFCDTVEMFHTYFNPEQVRVVQGLFVQDMGKTTWDEPRGHWIDARTAYFVHGSSRRGSMGPTIASFALEEDARKFATEFGGHVSHFTGITQDMVILDGGALHDSRM